MYHMLVFACGAHERESYCTHDLNDDGNWGKSADEALGFFTSVSGRASLLAVTDAAAKRENRKKHH
jgi:hypothetical protein